MSGLNVAAIGVATVATFVISSVWYAVLDGRRAALLGGEAVAAPAPAPAAPPPWKLGVELLRSLTVSTVMATVVVGLEVASVASAVLIAVAAWAAFPGVLLTGSVLWDDVRPELAAIHAGDWLLKLLAITLIVAVWR